ncbi:hypothetical protein MKW94_006544 [Papaver nudicaule]|uniref:Uncharacterized protein n=1 Tax=Papaver nudicaule TaxID=74823 RepID=A0AA41VNZ4_PAPNU|nr:hypothetical protein [Papaver nudicaule]
MTLLLNQLKMQMDKRSILFDALAYLKDILHETKIEENRLNISSTADADAATADPGLAIDDSPTSSPDSAPGDIRTNHPPRHHLGVVSDKNVVNADVEGQTETIIPLALLEPSKPPYSAMFPAITKMEAEKLDEERYMLEIICNKARGAIGQVQRSVELLKELDFFNFAICRYGQCHMQFTIFLRVKKVKGSLLVTNTEDLLQRVKTAAKQLGLHLPCKA